MPSDTQELPAPRIVKISITGFQGSRSFTLFFDPDVNFLIGKNGCGKTTLINLINASLCGDTQTLLRSRFDTLEVSLSYGGKNDQCTLVFERIYNREDGSFRLEYKLVGPRGRVISERLAYDRDSSINPFARVLVDHGPATWRSLFGNSKFTPPVVTWLSIHRADMSRNSPTIPQIAESIQTPIDRKLEELINRAARYLSALDTRSSALSSSFQRQYFLSLIGYNHNTAFSQIFNRTETLDLDQEEATLALILSHLKIPPSEYRKSLSEHFETARRFLSEKEDSVLTVDKVLSLVDTYRIHELNGKWQAFEQDRASIYRPKTAFTKVINELFLGKELSFNERNQPVFSLGNGEKLQVSDLSSGEKQAFVILSEALVQEGRQNIYLADEPELSLHIEWQQHLVRHIRELNENCQVIFATHSPDILGSFSKNAFNMEKL